MEQPIVLNDLETAEVGGANSPITINILNNSFNNSDGSLLILGDVTNSFNTNSYNTNSFNTQNVSSLLGMKYMYLASRLMG